MAQPLRMTVVLPTYNEAENLPRMVAELLALRLSAPATPPGGAATSVGVHDGAPRSEVELGILVVDDASPDGTGRLADALCREHPGRVDVLHRVGKEGLGKAYVAGFAVALEEGADLVLQMDCDFSHQPSAIPGLLDALPAADMVLGSRFAPGGRVDPDWAWWRKLLSWFANSLYVRAILRLPLRDATGGFRLWRRRTLLGMDLARRIHSNGYVFQVEMAYVAWRLGYALREVPIEFPDRKAGESKMSLRIQLEAAARVVQVRRRHSALRPEHRATTT